MENFWQYDNPKMHSEIYTMVVWFLFKFFQNSNLFKPYFLLTENLVKFSRTYEPLEEFLKQAQLAKNVYLKNEFVQKMMLEFDNADENKDGAINFSEYVEKLNGKIDVAILEEFKRQFSYHNENEGGKISRREFQIMAETSYSNLKK